MNKKKRIIIGIIISLIIITGAIIINIKIKKDNTLKEENKIAIKNNYNDLSKEVDNYNKIREEYIELASDFFYETYTDKHNDYIEILNKYTDTMNNITKNIDNIDSRCNIIYDDININKICNSYKTLYEKLINLYIYDIKDYNKKITGYNDYMNKNIDIYNIEYKEYIDYNKDGKYEGIDLNEAD